MNQDEFSEQLNQAFKSALKDADAIRALAESDRQAALKELDAASEFRLKTEREAEAILDTYLQDKRSQLIDFTRKELLRHLVVKHLNNGKSTEEIADWLEVTPDFISEVTTIFDRLKSYKTAIRQVASSELGQAELMYKTNGRTGIITFKNNQTTFDLWWEFAGGNALAIIGLPGIDNWTKKTNLPLTDMDPVIQFIGEQVVFDQTSGRGFFIVSDDYITIYKYI